MSGKQINARERVLAPLLIFLVTAASLAVLVYLTTRMLSCVNSISAGPVEESRQAAGNGEGR